MIRLPEKVRRTLQRVVNQLKMKESVYGVSLFGSWSRGDAVPSSDIDLLILDNRDFNHEYAERMQSSGLFIDLNYVPKRWVRGAIPPELDQKLHEMQILYDRDWSLTNTRLLMARSFASPERVDIRTEAHVVDSDVYLSRATSAFSREDFRSARLFSTVAFESIMKVLVEVAVEPFCNSRVVEAFEKSTAKLGLQNYFSEYLGVSGLGICDEANAKAGLKSFRAVWDDLSYVVKRNARELEGSHFRVRTKLEYYLCPAFLQGLVLRANALIDGGCFGEAVHYLRFALVDVLENYVWLRSSVDGVRVDFSVLVRSLEGLEGQNVRNAERVVALLGLEDVDEGGAADVVERARRVARAVRGQRKVLISSYLTRSSLEKA